MIARMTRKKAGPPWVTVGMTNLLLVSLSMTSSGAAMRVQRTELALPHYSCWRAARVLFFLLLFLLLLQLWADVLASLPVQSVNGNRMWAGAVRLRLIPDRFDNQQLQYQPEPGPFWPTNPL